MSPLAGRPGEGAVPALPSALTHDTGPRPRRAGTRRRTSPIAARRPRVRKPADASSTAIAYRARRRAPTRRSARSRPLVHRANHTPRRQASQAARPGRRDNQPPRPACLITCSSPRSSRSGYSCRERRCINIRTGRSGVGLSGRAVTRAPGGSPDADPPFGTTTWNLGIPRQSVQNGVICNWLQIDKVRRWSSPGSARAGAGQAFTGPRARVPLRRRPRLVPWDAAPAAVESRRSTDRVAMSGSVRSPHGL